MEDFAEMTRRTVPVIFLFLFLIMRRFALLSTALDKAAYHKISAEETHEMMASQEVVVVDVRTREE